MGMESLNDMFFTSAGKETLTYDQILEDVQKYCTEKHADKLTTEGNRDEARKLLREFISQYIIHLYVFPLFIPVPLFKIADALICHRRHQVCRKSVLYRICLFFLHSFVLQSLFHVSL